MSDETARLKLPQLVSLQELNAVTWNEALANLDTIIDLCLLGQFTNTPPVKASDGDAYLIGGAPTGAWTGYAYKIATCRDGAWSFAIPFNGLRAFVRTTGALILYLDGQWIEPGDIDVFLVAGQSNAVGQGVAASSPVPAPGSAFQYYNGAVTPAVDPVGGANTGSAWPSFAITYYNATGRKIAFVPAAVSSSAQCAAADAGAGNWDAAGALYGASTTAMDAALIAFAAAGYRPRVKGVLWAQGETDGKAYNDTTITGAAYQTALAAMIARYRGKYGAALPFYIFKTGTTDGSVDTGFATVRAAQEAVAAADPYTKIVFRNAYDFFARGMKSSGSHYTQPGYNEMGATAAANVVSGNADNGFQPISNGTSYFDDGAVRFGYPVDPGGNIATVTAIGGTGVLTPGSGYLKGVTYGGQAAVMLYRINGTPIAPTAVLSGQTIAAAYAGGRRSDGTFNLSAKFGFVSTEDYTGTANGTAFILSVAANGTTAPRAALTVANTGRIQMNVSAPPSSATDTGNPGEISWDANYFYFCTAANTWGRVARNW